MCAADPVWCGTGATGHSPPITETEKKKESDQQLWTRYMSSIVVYMRMTQRNHISLFWSLVSCKHNISEEGMYDNPTYMWSKPANLVHKGKETGPQQPQTRDGRGHHQTAVLNTGEEGEDMPYHKVINPLYCSSMTSDPTLQPPVPNLDYDPCYATPSFPYSHVDMEHRPEDSRDTCDIYEAIEK